MKVLQLIDSLRPGGAEQMAVSYANALARRGVESYLCCTRMEGLLKKRLEPGVGYLFLEKRHMLDTRAFTRLRNFVKEHGIQIIQAHSSSYFLAVLVKMSLPGLKIIWHDHYGRELGERKDGVLKWMSGYFDGVISVNEALKAWGEENLKVKNVVYIKNFLPDSLSSFDRLRMTGEGSDKSFDKLRMTGSTTKLQGEHKTKIICVANLRPQKDHFNLFRAFELVLEEYPDVSLHLVGKDEGNTYSRELKAYVLEKDLKESIFFYGEQENVQALLKQADIAVLSSVSEGLPVALLEYGMAGLPVVCTEVGEIKRVLKGNGSLVSPSEPLLLAKAITQNIRDQELAQLHAQAFQDEILINYSETAIMPGVISFFETITKN